jgi:drug/metabolite transporter (DMT)-like permease
MNKIGLSLAILSAIGFALQSLLIKKGVEDSTPLTTLIFSLIVPVVLFLPYVIYTGIPELGSLFFPALFANILFIGGGILLKIKALEKSDASLVAPISSFIPIFLLILTPIMIEESFTTLDIIGVLLIVSGSYLIEGMSYSEGILEPIKSLTSDTGVQFMMGYTLLISIGSTIDKIGIGASSTIFWLISLYTAISISTILIHYRRKESLVNSFYSNPSMLLLIGISTAIMIGSQLAAYNFTQVTFTLSIKRTGIIGIVIGGFIIFNENNLKSRLISSIPMVIGAAMITI